MMQRQKLDAVLPLIFNDYKRFGILDASLKKFLLLFRIKKLNYFDQKSKTATTK